MTRRLLPLLVFVFASLIASTQGYTQATDQLPLITEELTPDERALFEKLQATGDLIYVNEVVRIYSPDQEDQPLVNKMVFTANDGLIQGTYVFYELTFKGTPSEMVIEYSFSTGQADWGRGSILITGDRRLHTQVNCNRSTCLTTVERNGTEVFSESQDL